MEEMEIIGMLIAVIALAAVVALLAANWKIFTKAGRAGWKSIVPIYGSYVAYDIAGVKNLFFVNLIGTVVFNVIGMQFMPVYDYYGYQVSGNAGVYAVLSVAYLVVMLVVTIKYALGLARAFGKGGGFAAGLIFFAPIFIMILGFGSAQYVGAGGAVQGWRCSCGTLNTPDSYYCKNCGNRMA